jgi:hypothetical protein
MHNIAQRFKVRASSAGKLMTNSRSKSEVLSKTAKTYIKEWILEQPEFFDMKVSDVSSIQMSKGNAVEKDAIDLIMKYKYNDQFMVPNTTSFEGDYMKGTPDAIMKDHIFDCKSSWAARSFPFFEEELPTKDYYWQGQVYMHMTDKKKHIVYYVLMDTPDDLIESAAYKKARELGFKEPTMEIWEDCLQRMKVDHVIPEMRIKPFEFEYDEQAVQQLIERVEIAREYINELCQTVLKG